MRASPTALLLLCAVAVSVQAETLDSIPRLRPGVWSVDTTGEISSATHSTVNQLGEEVQRQGRGQLAVVVVKTTGRQASRAFAITLFNQWGLGHAGRDDGALLFIALKDRKAEIVLGDGVDSDEDTQSSDALMSEEIIPAFKRGSPNEAVLAGARGLSQLLAQSPLNTPEAPEDDACPDPSADGRCEPLIEMEGEMEGESEGSTWSQLRIPAFSTNAWAWGGGAGGFIATGMGLRRWLRRRPRHCADCKSPRMLLDEVTDDAYLDVGQRKEEDLGSVDYDVWWCDSCQDARVERYGSWFTRYGKCPRCRYKTKVETSTTTQEATYDHGGTVRVDVHCKHCEYRNRFTRSTPRRTRPSSSSSSSGSSSGGGHSSGGGSSGSW